MWLACGSHVAPMSLGGFSGCGRKSLAEVKGKRLPAFPGMSWHFPKKPKWSFLGSPSGPISRDIAILSLRCPISRDSF